MATTQSHATAVDLTAFQRDMLFVLAGTGESSGQDLKRQIEERYPADINHGRLYPNLDDMVDRGLVEKGQYDRRTNRYAISDRGESVLAEQHDWEAERL